MKTGMHVWGCLVLAALAFACGSAQQERSAAGDELRATVDSLKGTGYFTRLELRAGQQRELEGFYRDRNYEPAWNQADSLFPAVDSLLAALDSAGAEGLDPEAYRVAELRRLRETARRDTSINREKSLAQLDLLATTEYLKYASHLLTGRIDPHALDTNWIAHPRRVDLNAHLRKALERKTIRQSLLELLPNNPQYGRLKAQLARYRAAARGEESPGNASLTGTRTAGHLSDDQLRNRLAFYGLMDTARAASGQPGRPDHLGTALKQFQQLNGLDTTGVVDDSTGIALNRPAADVIQTLQINLERLRWQPESLGDRYVSVNVPGSELKVYENETELLHMRVIVGNEYAVTPIFTDTLEYIIFSPDWTIPLTIAREEILPVLGRNPNYLRERNMVLYDSWDTVQARQLDPREVDWRNLDPETFKYRIVQRPGEANPMGRMKFMLPNPLFIYLHDTPASFLFQSKDRALSHGCIRVERPDELANYLLAGNNGWNAGKMNQYTRLKEPKRVDLQRKLPIAVTYHTAWVDQAGRLNLRRDVYGLDRKQLAAIGQQKQMLSGTHPHAHESDLSRRIR